ncbi:SIS domain-containing protein [Hahella sp. KA22]|uniref:MurR/RpiR family transcriptional regulator n=1 Tax=Hahella sp. KA22 TaxID=1628392 RepID=UPI000FDF441D|nr:MurR/RpiR family transcriptional regulator [Hahella sp. KA22]AZZ90205.1 MurR/RpiR family transcriptional regulator [Hahella sp. KA22]QAY53575.1 SIS domain-containing protein [Hahella sp. KA22]
MGRPHDILNWLRQNRDSLRKSEQKVAECVLRNPNDVIHMRIVDLATEAGVSEPTIVRFCRTISFDSFQSLKVSLAQQLASMQTQMPFPINSGDSLQQIGARIFSDVQSSLQQVFNQLSWERIEQVCAWISESSRLYFFGYGASAAVAADAQQKFFRLKLNTQACPDPDMQMLIAGLVEENDVIVAISHSGRTNNLIQSCMRARASGARVVAISPSQSALANIANLNISVSVDEDTDAFTPLASRLAHLMILDTIATNLFQKLDKRHTQKLNQAKKNLSSLRLSPN